MAKAWAGLVLSVFAALPTGAGAADAFEISGYFNLDLTGEVGGERAHRLRELNKLHVDLGVDLAELIGWSGASAHFSVLNTSGARPNQDIGSLQGYDNIEVAGRRLRLYEGWVEQLFAADRVSLRVGLYDFNTEFYVTDAASLLIAPAFGIGPEAAASGPAGPPVYPTTSLTARLRFEPTATTYLQAAVMNAHIGSVGEPDGVNVSFDHGVLTAVEAGWTGRGKIAVGAWRYSERLDDLIDVDLFGAPLQRQVQGVYLLAETRLFGASDAAGVDGFVRLGVSDGDTNILRAGWQAGVLVGPVAPGRPDSRLSFGIEQAVLSDKGRALLTLGGTASAATETGFELTYADQISEHVTLQPDIQYILNPGGDRAAKSAAIATLRLTVDF